MKKTICIFLSMVLLIATPAFAKKKKKAEEKPKDDTWVSSSLNGLKWRSIGPALTSGRVGDFAVDPENPAHFYVAVCSGGVWETQNAGTTFKPVFEKEGSYSIGCITMDPQDSKTLWVGTGENNSQRSVGYGDGVYLSRDGGASWANMGLKDSEHIGKILVHPNDSKIVFVAAQGPLWRAGGDRGLYRTKDGGKNWEQVLKVSDQTGVNEVMMDPSNPDVLYASTYQRRRHVWTLINGGPESTIYKSTDGGDSWFKQNKGLPKGDLGRIGMAISSKDPQYLYAIVEATKGNGGFFRSLDGGQNWEKMSSYISSSPQYYQEICVDPNDSQTIYSLDTYLHRSLDGGKTFERIGNSAKHVDNHAIWINPANSRYILVGCDGGIYETFDKGETWKYMPNLPITQFYHITADYREPFYYVYGGTQDNFSLGAPSRTINNSGVTNEDWFVTLGGDGYQSQIDPENPDIVYAEYQYGGLARFDKKSGERVYIQPQPGPDSVPLKWNWNTPLLISPHNNHRLYYGANILFRSDDQGNTWRPISPDLSRQVNRNELEVMGKVWPIDSVAKNKSTSFFGSLVSLSESEKIEGLIYGGTDDGLIQVTQDGGETWQRHESFPGVPEWAYVSDVVASQHNDQRVYASFDNHKKGDFKPYILVSEDRGNTWKSIQSNLPERGTVYCIAEDHQSPDLLFAGTEFGVFFSPDRGGRWVQLKSGLPVIAVRDLSIQKRENDLVIATFGRGIYVLDNYTPLRHLSEKMLKDEDTLFPVKDAWQFIVSNPRGYRQQGQLGNNYFYTENPPYGAVFSYYLHEGFSSLKDKRVKAEKEKVKDGKNPGYPTWEELEKEKRELPWKVYFEITDESGKAVSRIEGPATKGLHRVAWNLRYPTTVPPRRWHGGGKKADPYSDQTTGHLAIPGAYQVTMILEKDGKPMPVGEPRSFKIKPLGLTTLPAKDDQALLEFRQKAAELSGVMSGVQKVMDTTNEQLKLIEKTAFGTIRVPSEVLESTRALKDEMFDIEKIVDGDTIVSSHEEPILPGLAERIGNMSQALESSLSAPTQTQLDTFDIIKDQLSDVLARLKSMHGKIEAINKVLEENGAPWTPGRIPNWPKIGK